jgi:hypothetical protein
MTGAADMFDFSVVRGAEILSLRNAKVTRRRMEVTIPASTTVSFNSANAM